jgi:hypothetical protein
LRCASWPAFGPASYAGGIHALKERSPRIFRLPDYLDCHALVSKYADGERKVSLWDLSMPDLASDPGYTHAGNALQPIIAVK